MFFRPRPVHILVTAIAIGVAIAIGYAAQKRRSTAAPEQPEDAPEQAPLLEPISIEATAFPVKPAKRPVADNRWYMRSDALRRQRLRKLADALFKAG